MPGPLITGRKLKKLAKQKKNVGRTPAKKIVAKIRQKYGMVQEGTRYYYRGGGDVAKYSAERDARRRASRRWKHYKNQHKGDSTVVRYRKKKGKTGPPRLGYI